MADELHPFDLSALEAAFRDFVPHNKALGLEITHFNESPAWLDMRMPWNDALIGNPDTRVLHGGVITTLVDAAGGAVIYLAIRRFIPIATLDLRIDFLGPSAAGLDVFARAECIKTTRNVAFVRMLCTHDLNGAPFATAAATYMLSTKGKSVVEP